MKKPKHRPGHRPPPGYDPDQYQRPSVAADAVILKFSDGRLRVLLIQRKHDPYAGKWALPGGFVEMTESISAAALREVFEETGLRGLDLVPLETFSRPDRDPRTRVISAAFLALVPPGPAKPKAGDDARRARWFPLDKLPELAFDHDQILAAAQERLRELSVLTPKLLTLLPPRFSAAQFLKLCRQALGRKYQDAALFFEALSRTPAFKREAGARSGPAQYRFDPELYHDGDFMFLLLQS